MALLNWNSPKHYDHTGDKPCVCCGKPTPLRSDRGKSVHKVCAEEWIDAHTTRDIEREGQ